ncbi:MAG: copper homeostasis protein [Pseudomonadota bacterium]|jgi:copper homeostasis protein
MLIEICVDDAAGLSAAMAGGADRVELCAALSLGGLTPSAGFMKQAALCAAPVFAMIRPRAGDFVFSAAEVGQMQADIVQVQEAGLAGVVLGANLPDGRLDAGLLAHLIATAGSLGKTLHRAFDLTPDPFEALETAIDLGFDRILSSGQAPAAPQGAAMLERLFAQADGRITIMPGAGINAQTVRALRNLPVREIHASCAVSLPQTGPAEAFGFAPPVLRRTEAAQVRALRNALTSVD